MLFKRAKINIYDRVVSIIPSSNLVYLVEINKENNVTRLPRKSDYSQFLQDVSNKYLFLEREDPFLVTLLEEDLTPAEKNIRDQAWDKLQFIVNDNRILDPLTRGELVKSIIEAGNSFSKATIYKWIKAYFRNGMTPNALVPSFENCGAPGVPKRKLPENVIGLIKRGFKEFYFEKGDTISDARRNTIRIYWNADVHGKEKFSIRDFKKYGTEGMTAAEITKAREGVRKFRSTKRLLTGRASDLSDGPGSVYQIDWTTRDIHIVDSISRKFYIGKPTFYGIIDIESTAITGFYLTLDNPSFNTFAQAVYYTAIDKVEYAGHFGLSIKKEDYPMDGLPQTFIADNGEAKSILANVIGGMNLKITLGNVQAYRPEYKALVENLMNRVQQRVRTHFINKGEVLKKENNYLNKDTRMDACITFEELNKITFLTVIEFNKAIIKKFKPSRLLIKDAVGNTPLEIWNWAMINGYGIQKYFPQDMLMANLLPAHYKVPDRDGFEINGQSFVPIDPVYHKILEGLINEDKKDPQKITYSQTCYDQIFWFYKDKHVPLRPLGKKEAVFASEWEAIAIRKFYQEKENEYNKRKDDIMISTDEKIAEILANIPKNKRVNLRNIKNARQLEKSIEKKKDIAIKESNSTNAVIRNNFTKEDKQDYGTNFEQELDGLDM